LIRNLNCLRQAEVFAPACPFNFPIYSIQSCFLKFPVPAILLFAQKHFPKKVGGGLWAVFGFAKGSVQEIIHERVLQQTEFPNSTHQ
jgi:hypothetical protein